MSITPTHAHPSGSIMYPDTSLQYVAVNHTYSNDFDPIQMMLHDSVCPKCAWFMCVRCTIFPACLYTS